MTNQRILHMYDVEEELGAALADIRHAGADLEEGCVELELVIGGQSNADRLRRAYKKLKAADERYYDVCGRLEELAADVEAEDVRGRSEEELLDELEADVGLDGVIRLISDRLRREAEACPYSAAGIIVEEGLLHTASQLDRVVAGWGQQVVRGLEEREGVV